MRCEYLLKPSRRTAKRFKRHALNAASLSNLVFRPTNCKLIFTTHLQRREFLSNNAVIYLKKNVITDTEKAQEVFRAVALLTALGMGLAAALRANKKP